MLQLILVIIVNVCHLCCKQLGGFFRDFYQAATGVIFRLFSQFLFGLGQCLFLIDWPILIIICSVLSPSACFSFLYSQSEGKYMPTHTHTHIYIYICVCVCVCVCTYICIYMCVYVCVCMMCVYMYVCVCVYICMYIQKKSEYSQRNCAIASKKKLHIYIYIYIYIYIVGQLTQAQYCCLSLFLLNSSILFYPIYLYVSIFFMYLYFVLSLCAHCNMSHSEEIKYTADNSLSIGEAGLIPKNKPKKKKNKH